MDSFTLSYRLPTVGIYTKSSTRKRIIASRFCHRQGDLYIAHHPAAWKQAAYLGIMTLRSFFIEGETITTCIVSCLSRQSLECTTAKSCGGIDLAQKKNTQPHGLALCLAKRPKR